MLKKLLVLLSLAALLLTGCNPSKQIDKAALAECVVVSEQNGEITYTFYIISQEPEPVSFSVRANDIASAYKKAKSECSANLSLSKLELYVAGDGLYDTVLKNDISLTAKSSELSPLMLAAVCDKKTTEFFAENKDAAGDVKELILLQRNNNKSVKANALSLFNSFYSEKGRDFDISYISFDNKLKSNSRKIKLNSEKNIKNIEK